MRINWKEPNFWRREKLSALHPAHLLSPLASLLSAHTQKRILNQQPVRGVPVVCCGGLTVGGAGKTTLAITIAKYLEKLGFHPAFVSRGYKGELNLDVPYLVKITDRAEKVGDEPKLLSELFPCWIGKDRLATARAAVSSGADCLVLDDGLQNSTLKPTLTILAINGSQGVGNSKLIPQGPLRETLSQVKDRIDAVVFYGEDSFNLLPNLEKDFNVYKAQLTPASIPTELKHQKVIAFAGLNDPSKFFNMLKDFNIETIKNVSFPNHYAYTAKDIRKLRAIDPYALLLCTPKDYVKIPEALREGILTIKPKILWDDKDAISKMLEHL